jgi:hypothetical protein
VHLLDGAGCGDDAGAEPVGEQVGGEPMVTVSMRDEDMGEVLVAGVHPVTHGPCLLAGKWRID